MKLSLKNATFQNINYMFLFVSCPRVPWLKSPNSHVYPACSCLSHPVNLKTFNSNQAVASHRRHISDACSIRGRVSFVPYTWTGRRHCGVNTASAFVWIWRQYYVRPSFLYSRRRVSGISSLQSIHHSRRFCKAPPQWCKDPDRCISPFRRDCRWIEETPQRLHVQAAEVSRSPQDHSATMKRPRSATAQKGKQVERISSWRSSQEVHQTTDVSRAAHVLSRRAELPLAALYFVQSTTW